VKSGPTVGVLSPLAGGFYYGGILTGVARTMAAAGGRMIAIQTLDAGHVNADFVELPSFDSRLAWDHISGFITVVNAVRPEYLAKIQHAGKPLILVSNDVPGLECPSVMPDNRAGIIEAVRHLVDHGHTRIGFAGFLGQNDIRERYAAYQEALLTCGIEPDPKLYFPTGDNDETGGVTAGQAMIAAGLPSTAIVAATDLNAIGILKTLRAAGYSLPRDQAVTGFDDTEAAAHITPVLSSAKQDFEQVGALAAALMLACLRGEAVPPGRRSIATSFVTRESCGCSAWQSNATAGAGAAAAASTDTGTGVATATREFVETIEAALTLSGQAVGPEVLTRAVQRVSALFDAAIADRELPPIGGVRDSMAELHRAARTPEIGTAIIKAVRRFAQHATQRAAGTGNAERARARVDDAAISAIWTLAQAQGSDAYERDCYVQTLLAAQYDVSMELLQGVEGDPRDLRWLALTQARAGVLALWSDEAAQTVELAGRYDRDETDRRDAGPPMRIEAFPPESLFDADPNLNELVFAVPVKSNASDWGWLVTVGPVEATSLTGRETANQWGALLTVALDRAKAGNELKSLERELRAILGNSPDAIARYDAHLRYEYLNAAAESALGAASHDVVGHTDHELGRDPAVAAIWEAGLRQVLVSSSSTEIEFSQGTEGDTRWYQAKMVPQFGSDGMITGVLTSTRDLTAVKRAELALAHQAVHDSLTGLANRVLFVDRASQAVGRLEREAGRVALLFIDLDRFKAVNDTLGHDVGDRLLVEVASRLVKVSRRVDTVGRFGGDEFVLLCDKLSAAEDVRIIGERVVRALAKPFVDGGHELEVSGSVGIVVAADPYADVSALLRNADSAMYQAKERGGNRFHLFDPDLRDRATARHLVEADLRHALERKELKLLYQPLFALKSGAINGVEALLRWDHPTRGRLAPEHFMSVAEQRGLIIPIGAWVLDEACRQLAAWRSAGALSTITMAVNVSGRQLADPAIVGLVRDAIRRHDVPASRLTLEITETTLIEDAANLRDTLSELAGLGVHLALDDFGTGYSALAHLRDFRVDILKIDRSFVEQLGDGGRAREIVGALTAMAHFLDMTVVGEGIETSKQLDELKNLACDTGQGFVVSRPLEPADLVELLARADRRRGDARR
jgi:diguanylate cyclase (GGDEF)-like protein/PAS domain S-box-containing protein